MVKSIYDVRNTKEVVCQVKMFSSPDGKSFDYVQIMANVGGLDIPLFCKDSTAKKLLMKEMEDVYKQSVSATK